MDRVKRRTALAAFCLSATTAAVAPLLARTETAGAGASPAWPSHYEGHPLTELPLSSREAAFLRDFPGRVGRFSDGSREIIIRRVDAATRRLHSASDCLRGAGYAVTPLPARQIASGEVMSCLRASRGADSIEACEVIRDGRGATWPDVSAWYWSALLGRESGPWWSYVVSQRAAPQPLAP